MGTQLVADFDNGTIANDALGHLIYQKDLGLALDEGLIAQGDSGGPAFLTGLIAGVASYTSSLSRGSVQPDFDSIPNSSFGEIAAWQRVSAVQQWIDQSLRNNYPDAPARREDVKLSVSEGDVGTTYVYFYVEYSGLREGVGQVVSVDYATRDGTAVSGSDYIAASGTLYFYPAENYAVIPVEILSDSVSEPVEFFYLDIFNPVGGSFAGGVAQLTAVRTILDDDGWLV